MAEVILNKTKSSKERWKLDMLTNELINGKLRREVTEFFNSAHTDIELVRGYLTDAGYSNLIPTGPKGWQTVDTSVDDDSLIPPEFGMLVIKGSVQDIQRYFAELNRTKGKGATRRLRKELQRVGLGRYAALPAQEKIAA